MWCRNIVDNNIDLKVNKACTTRSDHAKFWDAGLPIQHDKMTYYLNLFPFWCGADRPVGPESDPNSMLGYTKWLIEQVKPESQWVGSEDFIFSPLVFDYQYYCSSLLLKWKIISLFLTENGSL